jgi:hypothetical protein
MHQIVRKTDCMRVIRINERCCNEKRVTAILL